MASDVVKTKELPVVDQYTDVSLEDRVVASHVIEGEERETVAITVGALGKKFMSEAMSNTLIPRNYFGSTDPSDSFGNDGDLYFKIISNAIDTGFYKLNGSWKSFKLGDGWGRFLEGEAFDIVSDAATINNTAIKSAFNHNTLIRNVIMPKCKTIEANTFSNSSIVYVSMPEVETIGDGAFSEITTWSEYTTPDNPMNFSKLKTIGSYAFNFCRISDGRPVYFDMHNVEEIKDHAFYQGPSARFVPYGDNSMNLIFPKLKKIGDGAFSTFYTAFSRGVKDIVLEKIEETEDSAFGGIEFPEDLNDNNHAIIVFGEHITSIGDNLLNGAKRTGLRGQDPLYGGDIYGAYIDMYIRAVTPPTLNGCFNYKVVFIPDVGDRAVREIMPNIYVPEGSVTAYKSADTWSIYADYIQAIPPEGIPKYD